jgi:hypothetical protein
MSNEKEILPAEDKDIAVEFIILELLIKSLEFDIKVMKQSKMKLKDQHVHFLEYVLSQALKDAAANKKLMTKKGIRVFSREPINEDFVRYPFIIRGYESDFRFFISALKVHTANKLESYYKVKS